MKNWFYVDSQRAQQQIPEAHLEEAVKRGVIVPTTKVWSSGMPNWGNASEELPHLFGAPSPDPEGAPERPAPPSLPPKRDMSSHEIDYEIFGNDMQIVEVELDPGETVIAEAGAMNYMDQHISFEAKMGDGSTANEGMMGKLLAVGKRALSGESIFMTHFTHGGTGGKQRVAFAAPFPGRIIPVDLGQIGGELTCQKDSFLCAAFGTKVSIAFNRKLGAGFFGGEGFILQKLCGDGKAFIHAGGTVIERELKGETLRVDTGCLVGFTPGVSYDIQKAGNLKSMFFGGEGLFLATLSGHGKVWLQSLPFSRLAERVVGQMGASRSQGEGSALGALGNLFGD